MSFGCDPEISAPRDVPREMCPGSQKVMNVNSKFIQNSKRKK